MNGRRALEILDGFTAGKAPDATDAELRELVAGGLLTEVDESAVRWAADLDDVRKRHPFETVETAREILDELTKKLRSDVHRMATSDEKLAAEQADVVRLRTLVGVLSDAPSSQLLNEASAAWRGARVPLQRGKRPGRVYALAPAGSRAAEAIRARWARYAEEPLAAFLKRFNKVDAAVAALAADVAYLNAHLPHLPKEKARPGVLTGLLKSGLPPKQAVAAYQEALGKAQMGQPVERPGLAVAVVRNRAANQPMADVAERLKAARKALSRRRLPDGPVLRGAAKSLLPYPDLEAAADRFASLVSELQGQQVASDGLKLAARLMSVDGEPRDIVKRCRRAADLLMQEPLAQPDVPAASVSLGALAPTLEAVPAVVQRFAALRQLLLEERAFGTDPPPASVAELLGGPGTPEEIVDVLKSLISSLNAGRLPSAWGQSSYWEIACGLAKRFAY